MQDPAAVWSTLLQRLGGVSSLAWLDHLTLVRIEPDHVVLAPQPGYENAARFARNPARTERLRSELADLLGRRVQISVQSESQGETGSAQSTDQAPSEARESSAPSSNQEQLAAARELSLVRDVMEAFPDARPVEVRQEKAEKAGKAENAGNSE